MTNVVGEELTLLHSLVHGLSYDVQEANAEAVQQETDARAAIIAAMNILDS